MLHTEDIGNEEKDIWGWNGLKASQKRPQALLREESLPTRMEQKDFQKFYICICFLSPKMILVVGIKCLANQLLRCGKLAPGHFKPIPFQRESGQPAEGSRMGKRFIL